MKILIETRERVGWLLKFHHQMFVPFSVQFNLCRGIKKETTFYTQNVSIGKRLDWKKGEKSIEKREKTV